MESGVNETNTSTVSFCYDLFLEYCQKWKDQPPCYTRRKCNKIIDVSVFERQASMLEVIHSAKDSSVRRQNLGRHVMNSYNLTWSSTKNHSSLYQLSTSKLQVYRKAWLFLHNFAVRTFKRWVKDSVRFDPSPFIGGLVGKGG